MKYYCIILLLVTLAISGSSIAQQKVAIDKLDSLQVFAKVEIESEFPGGIESWRNFLIDNLKYPGKARRKNIQGTVVVQFIVNKDGSLTDYEAISGPPELRNAAVNVIKKSPKWIPAQQSGKKVKSYKKQPIAFRL